MKWFSKKEAAPVRIEPIVTPTSKPEMRVNAFALDAMQSDGGTVFRVCKPLPGVVPVDRVPMAMDDASNLYSYEGLISQNAGLSFPGFPLLAELAQRPEYRHISETMAREMTRKWGELTSTGNGDKSAKIEIITQRMKDLDVQGKLKTAAVHDGLFGRGHIYLDIDNSFSDDVINQTPLKVTPNAIRKGAKFSLRNVEPIWTYPNDYDSHNPMSPDFYKPRSWFVMGKNVHKTRLLTFVGRELPDLLKPAYGFSGLSRTQMAIPYVQNWLRTRQSVSDMLHSFSTMVLNTNMGAVLQGGGVDGLITRAQLYNQTRDNRGLMMVDKDTEELTNVSAPMSGLDHLQAQSQEQMASVSAIPLVKLLGVTPSGLNASSDGEIRVFYDTIEAEQAALLRNNLVTIIEIIQIIEFGAIDDGITWKFNPLWQLDEAGEAAVRKTDADTDIELIDAGVISPLEARQRLAASPGSGYNNLDVDDVPEPPEAPGGEITDPETNRIDEGGESGNSNGGNSGV